MPRHGRDTNRAKPLGQNQTHLAEHLAAIAKLKQDNESLRSELSMELKHSKQLLNPALKQELHNVHNKIDNFTRYELPRLD